MREKSYHALYAAAAAALVFGLTPATKVLADEVSPSDETTTEQATQETTQEVTPVVQADPNVSATPVQPEQQQTYSVQLNAGMPGVSVPEMNSYTAGVETPLPELKKDGLKFRGWICISNMSVTGPQQSISADLTGDLEYVAAWAADYRITEGQDAKWVKGSQTPLTLKVNSTIGDFDKIFINGKQLNENDFKITYVDVGERFLESFYNNGTIIQILPSYLESLPVGQPLKVHIVYGPDNEIATGGFFTHCEMDGTFTLVEQANPSNANETNTVATNTNQKKETSTNAATPAPTKVEKTTTTSSVNTGVSDSSGAWFVAALASAMGALGLPVLKKRNQ